MKNGLVIIFAMYVIDIQWYSKNIKGGKCVGCHKVIDLLFLLCKGSKMFWKKGKCVVITIYYIIIIVIADTFYNVFIL